MMSTGSSQLLNDPSGPTRRADGATGVGCRAAASCAALLTCAPGHDVGRQPDGRPQPRAHQRAGPAAPSRGSGMHSSAPTQSMGTVSPCIDPAALASMHHSQAAFASSALPPAQTGPPPPPPHPRHPHLEEGVRHEEERGAQAVGGAAEPQVAVQLQRRKRQVGAVQVAQHAQREEPAGAARPSGGTMQCA